MQLDLTDEDTGALLNLLTGTIEGDQYPMPPQIRMLRRIRAKLPGIPPESPAMRSPRLEQARKARAASKKLRPDAPVADTSRLRGRAAVGLLVSSRRNSVVVRPVNLGTA